MLTITKPRGWWITQATEARYVSRNGSKVRANLPVLFRVTGNTVEYRVKGTRKVFSLPHDKAFGLAQKAEADAIRAAKGTRRRSIRRGAIRT